MAKIKQDQGQLESAEKLKTFVYELNVNTGSFFFSGISNQQHNVHLFVRDPISDSPPGTCLINCTQGPKLHLLVSSLNE